MDPSKVPPGLNLAQLPAGRPPRGTTPNFISPVTLKAPIVAINIIFLTLATIFVSLRIYTRKFLNRTLSPEDYVCVLSLLGSGAHSGLLFYLVNHDFGKHLWDVQAIKLIPRLAHVGVALGLTYGLVIFLVKTSVLLLFYNLFGVNRTMRSLVFLGISVSAALCVALTSYNIAGELYCVDAVSLHRRICINGRLVTIASGTINTLIDFYILVLPIAMVLRLQLTPRHKLGVVAIFIVGLLAVIASLVRLVLSAQRGRSVDQLWDAGLTSISDCIEMNVGIVCASVPAMPMFFRQHKLGLQPLKAFGYRLFGKFSSERPVPRRSSAKKAAAKSKSFHGISLNMTSPSLGMKSNLGVKGEDYIDLEEGHDRRFLASQT